MRMTVSKRFGSFGRPRSAAPRCWRSRRPAPCARARHPCGRRWTTSTCRLPRPGPAAVLRRSTLRCDATSVKRLPSFQRGGGRSGKWVPCARCCRVWMYLLPWRTSSCHSWSSSSPKARTRPASASVRRQTEDVHEKGKLRDRQYGHSLRCRWTSRRRPFTEISLLLLLCPKSLQPRHRWWRYGRFVEIAAEGLRLRKTHLDDLLACFVAQQVQENPDNRSRSLEIEISSHVVRFFRSSGTEARCDS